MKQAQRALLLRCETALTDWVRTYAGDQCTNAQFNETCDRLRDAGGTLAYVGRLIADIRAELRRGKK